MKYTFHMTYMSKRSYDKVIRADDDINAWRAFREWAEGFETDGEGYPLVSVKMERAHVKWRRTTTGLESDDFIIERIVDKNMSTGKMQVWGFRLTVKATGESFSNGTMRDAKEWAERINRA